MRYLLTIVIVAFAFIAKTQPLKITDAMLVGAKVSYNTIPVPYSFKKAFKAEYGEYVDIANAGAKYNATDVIYNPLLPRRRLIVFASSPNINILYYEHGGRGHHNHCIIQHNNIMYSIDVAFTQCTTFEQLKKYLLQNNFKIDSIGCQY
jgi:hypothetical protein